MSHDWIADINFFNLLRAEDVRVAAAVKEAGCRRCGGRLDRADYPRKPRGGEVGAAGEGVDRRGSFCCARVGCRKRTTPPSLVFLGRRVYLAITVVVASWRSATTSSRTPPWRTVRRWRAWFAALRSASWFGTVAGRIWPAIEPGELLPGALVERFLPGSVADALVATLRLLASWPTRLASSE